MSPIVRDAETAAGAAIEAPRWRLDDLYAAIDDPAFDRDLAAAARDADAFAERYKGKVADLDAPSLLAAIEAYERLQETMGKAMSFAGLKSAGDREDAAIGQFMQNAIERTNAISSKLVFFTLEIAKIDDDALSAKIADDPSLARYRPFLRDVRAFRPHQLSDEIEQLLHEKSVAGRGAWVRLFDETMAGLRFPFEGEQLTAAQIFDKMQSPERTLREKAADGISATLSDNVKLFARITNTLIKDKEVIDRWRNYPSPISFRNLANQVEDEVVEALISTVREAYPRLSHRYYAIKAKWLGLDRLQFWDRNAPLPEQSDERLPWEEARAIVTDAYRGFSPSLAEIVARFFDRQWIDAELRPGKDSGAFCHSTVPSVHPYVLMNYQGRERDVMTLAHELGHGVHQSLAAKHGALMAGTPLTLAETASVFGEQLTFRALLERAADPKRQRLLIASKIEDMLNTVVRQIAFAEFEIAMHDARRKGELSTDQIGDIWMSIQSASLGPAFEFREDYRVYWSYIPHFVHAPFYVYAYAFGDCLVNSLYAVFEREPDGFEAKYLELLAAGGTLRHAELLAPFGLDARDPDFWRAGVAMIETLIDRLDGVMEA